MVKYSVVGHEEYEHNKFSGSIRAALNCSVVCQMETLLYVSFASFALIYLSGPPVLYFLLSVQKSLFFVFRIALVSIVGQLTVLAGDSAVPSEVDVICNAL